MKAQVSVNDVLMHLCKYPKDTGIRVEHWPGYIVFVVPAEVVAKAENLGYDPEPTFKKAENMVGCYDLDYLRTKFQGPTLRLTKADEEFLHEMEISAK